MALLLAFRHLALWRLRNANAGLVLLAILTLFALAVPFLLPPIPKPCNRDAHPWTVRDVDRHPGWHRREDSLGHGSIFGVAAYFVAYRVAIQEEVRGLGCSWGCWLRRLLLRFSALSRSYQRRLLPADTLAQGMIVWGICYRWTSVTGAENGIRGVDRPNSSRVEYLLLLCAAGRGGFRPAHMASGSFSVWNGIAGIKESPSRMRTLGYNVPLTLTSRSRSRDCSRESPGFCSCFSTTSSARTMSPSRNP